MSERSSLPLDGHTERSTLHGDLRRFAGGHVTPYQRHNRLVAGAFTVIAHIIGISVLIWPHIRLPSHVAPAPSLIMVRLVDAPKPTPPALLEPVKIQSGRPNTTVRTLPPAMSAPIETVTKATMSDNSDLMSESQLAGATTVGEGGGAGGTCDMGQIVQQALRRDPMVQAALEGAHRIGKTIMLWNGDWVRSGDQDGKGLSVVREAIAWEVAFAPEACRNMRVHGLLLLSLSDGNTRFALGSDDWRWSDLLGLRSALSER
jgi:hypothetical protein